MMPTPRNTKSIGRHLLVNLRLGTFIYPTTTPLLQWSTVLVPTIRALPPTPLFAPTNRWSMYHRHSTASTYLGVQDQQELLNTRLWGISASHQPIDGLFIGIKTEVFDTDNSGGYGGDGDRSTAAFVSYDYGKQTFKAMLADTDNYGEVSYTLGWDYRYSDIVKFFAEYYADEETSAITAERAGSEVFDTDASGGSALAAGVSLNFAW
ncbi:MAG: hypothetical protein P8101_14950 [Candidatus Thiodiazotropha sp.]